MKGKVQVAKRKRARKVRRSIRRKVSRKMPAALKRYWAKKRRRRSAPVFTLNEGRSRKGTATMARKSGKRRGRKFHGFRKSVGSAGSVGSGLKDVAINTAYGVGGVALNKILKNQIAKMVKVDPSKTAVVGVITAFGLKYLFAKVVKQPALARAMDVALTVEVFDAVKGYAPASVKTMLAGEETMTPTIPESPVMGFLPDFPLQGSEIPEAIVALEN